MENNVYFDNAMQAAERGEGAERGRGGRGRGE